MDAILRGINATHDIRIVAATTTALVREACQRHDLLGGDAVILGRALTAGCLLATLSKNDDERVRIQLSGEGPSGRVLVDARGSGHVRGCLSVDDERPSPTTTDPVPAMAHRPRVAHLVGKGRMMVTRDLGLEREYQGLVPLDHGEVDLDLEHYLKESEQVPSVLACEVVLDAHQQVRRAAGVLCQTLPEADVGQLDPIGANLHGDAFAQLLAVERTNDELMGFALLGAAFKSTDQRPLGFRCDCGPERARSVLSTLGADDIDKLAEERPQTEVKCNYCGDAYVLTSAELHELAEQLRRHRS